MRVATILDAGEILALDEKEAFTIGVVDRLKTGRSVTLLDDNEKACVIYDPLWNGKWIAHILSDTSIRGKGLWDFAHKTAKWMIEHREMKHLLIFAEKTNFTLRSFILYYRLNKATSVGNEALYIASAEQILNFGKETQQCHQYS